MVLVLVLATCVALFAAQWAVSRRQRRIEGEQRLLAASENLRADAVSLHPGMAWVGPLSRRAVTVGASEFALDFAGKIAAIELPPSGVRLREGHPAVTLVSKRGRRLSLPAPVAGRVLAVNPHPAADAKGWLLRVRPRPDGPVETLLQGNAAKHWIEEARALVLSRLEPAVGRMAQDGGVSQRAWGELLDDRTWTEIKNELFPESPAPMAREGTRPTRMEARR